MNAFLKAMLLQEKDEKGELERVQIHPKILCATSVPCLILSAIPMPSRRFPATIKPLYRCSTACTAFILSSVFAQY